MEDLTADKMPKEPVCPKCGPNSDYWVNWNSRRTLGGISYYWPHFNEPVCGDVAPTPDAECSRQPGHPGRHMGSLGHGYADRIVAAWPGTHPPVKNDLS